MQQFESDASKYSRFKKAIWECGVYEDVLRYLTKADFDVMKNGWRALQDMCHLLVTISNNSEEADGVIRKVVNILLLSDIIEQTISRRHTT